MTSSSSLPALRTGRTYSAERKAGGPKVAQVSLPHCLFHKCTYLEPRRSSGLEAFEPQALAGTAAHLLRLAEAAASGELRLPTLDHSLHVLTAFRDSPLNAHDRRSLWTAWGVPIYEILLDPDHCPLAGECEAHEGWHQESGVAFREISGQVWVQREKGARFGTGLRGIIDTAACSCGQLSPKLLNAALDLRDPLRTGLRATA